MKKYFSYRVEKAVRVTGLVTIESIGVSPGFTYPAETHDFYEFIYVDSGVLLCTTGPETVRLEQGDFLLTVPGREHFYHACGDHTADVFIICFRCRSEILSVLDRKVPLGEEERSRVREIIREAKNAFVFPFEKKLRTRPDPVFGAQQLVENHIEQLLVRLVRNRMRLQEDVMLVSSSLELEDHLVRDILSILREDPRRRLRLDDVCRQMHYSKTYLNGVFRKNTGYTIMQYYGRMRVEEAKKLLRAGRSPGEAADLLNYESVSYFTKVFRKHTGMTPAAWRKAAR